MIMYTPWSAFICPLDIPSVDGRVLAFDSELEFFAPRPLVIDGRVVGVVDLLSITTASGTGAYGHRWVVAVGRVEPKFLDTLSERFPAMEFQWSTWKNGMLLAAHLSALYAVTEAAWADSKFLT
jgi:hypothetical protein